MKTRKIIPILVCVALVVFFMACKKSRYCHCVTTEGAADTVVVNVDRGMKCEHILELGIDKLQDGEYVTTLQKVDCVELDMDTVATIPPRPEPED
ncbi:MAG: hypothetical protein J6X86_05130 [Bacteroidales bacterium]|nr:hypothetical protein [Bacteroidales bacterium]